MPDWKRYRRTSVAEMRPYILGEPLDGISVSAVDHTALAIAQGRDPGGVFGFVARNPADHNDQWFVAPGYAEANFDLDNPVVPDA